MARTVANGLITQALIDTQKEASRTPYIDITINSVNYWSRLEYIEYHEETYRDRAVIGLNNRDNALDSLDIDGQTFAIKLGYDSSGNGGTTTDTVTYPTMTVKSHQIISVGGDRIYQIYAEGMWMRLRKQKIIAGISGPREGLYSNSYLATYTVYELMKIVIEDGMGWTLSALPATDDGIIDTFRPIFSINMLPFENAAAILYRLIWMTKMYFRPKANNTFELVFPQTTDSADETYYSDKAHWFTEHSEKTILLEPNSIIVLCNQDPDTKEWNTAAYPIMAGTAKDDVQIAKHTEIQEPFIAGNIRTQTDADNRAAAILTRLKSEILACRTVVPHDARVELFDKVLVVDTRT